MLDEIRLVILNLAQYVYLLYIFENHNYNLIGVRQC